MPDINAGQLRFGLDLIGFVAEAVPVLGGAAIIMSIKTKTYFLASKMDTGRI
jgi:hypothetical protein